MNKAILFSKFIRYDYLDTLIRNTQSASVILKYPMDLYIDVQSVYKMALSENLMANDIKVISINILNLAAHYRHYFKSRFKIDVNVYIVNSISSLNKNIFEEVNSNNKDMFSILKILTPYFPLIYYIEKEGYNASAIILSMINKYTIPFNRVGLVVSNDIFSYQIPTLVPRDRVFVLKPSSKPKFISANNTIDYMFPRKSTNIITSDLSPALLPVIMAYHKCPELGMTLINNFKTSINIIREKINNGQILNNYNSPIIFQNEPIIYTRLCICDLMTITNIYNNSYASMVDDWKVEKQCNFRDLASILDHNFNTDQDNILNYVFLLE